MRKIISLICLLLPSLAFAALPNSAPEIRSDAPERHVVVKGDTLWDISATFFQDPWKWPQIWGLNKDTIKDPHWIYPGDIIYLDRINGTLRVNNAGSGSYGNSTSGNSKIIKLSPYIRFEDSEHTAVPSISAKAIAPFLTRPLVIEKDTLKDAATLIGAREGRVLLSFGDTGFAIDLPTDQGKKWQIYRPGKTFIDPETEEALGIEAIYLGNAEVTAFADVSTVTITKSVQEIRAGDRLIAAADEQVGNHLPRAPEMDIAAQIISVEGGVSQAGQNTVITLNKGARDGVESGHVLALYHKGEDIKSAGKTYTLPDQRYGLVFVFRVFEKVSYALVMETQLPAQLLDRAVNP